MGADIAAWILGAILLAIASGMLVRLANPLPAIDGRTESSASGNTADTRLGRMVAAAAAGHPSKSGVFALANPSEAFAARVQLARTAIRSLDLQYYIWKLDATGMLLLMEVLAAAERGVRVRLLLDDNVTAGLDSTLALLNAHPNIEIRLFNPFVIRRPRIIGYLTDFRRLNRRMHNKSFTADNQVTIVGGRNIGDEYMRASGGPLFADLDVLALGPITHDVSRKFDLFWASQSTYPFERIVKPVPQGQTDNLALGDVRVPASPVTGQLREAIRDCRILARLAENRLSLIWTDIRIVADDPAKGLGHAPAEKHLLPRMRGIMGRPSKQLKLVSPYFVPEKQGVEAFAALVRSGVDVTVLTNALEATNVPIVHSGYAHRRKALLVAGVKLFEMHAIGSTKAAVWADQKSKFWPVKAKHAEQSGTALGGSMTALHAKTFAVDRKRTFVGSFNFDPRSERLNTEMGLVIESPAFTQLIDDAFKSRIQANAYEVKLSPKGKLYWIRTRGEERVRYDVEPGTTATQRLAIGLLSLLPIEWLL